MTSACGNSRTAAEDLLEVIMGRYERASTLLMSNRPVDGWGKLLGDTGPKSHRIVEGRVAQSRQIASIHRHAPHA